MNEASLLISLAGNELGSVVFVRDYLQLVFDGPRLSAFLWPTVLSDSESRYGSPGYRDALCDLIGQMVTHTEESSEVGLVIGFGPVDLVLHPTLEELDGPEIAMLQLGDAANTWDVWRPGEGVFAELG